MVALKASRRSFTRSAGTPGGASTGRSRSCDTISSLICWRVGSSLASSSSVGASGNCGVRRSLTTIGTLIFFSVSHCGRSAPIEVSCGPQRP